jgi:hypothetical protein
VDWLGFKEIIRKNNMSGPVANNSLLFNLGMRYPTVAAAVATVATVATLNAPLQVADNAPAVENLPVLTKTIAG